MFLRFHGSPESKPVSAPHRQSGTRSSKADEEVRPFCRGRRHRLGYG
ncbi:hypothetical protein [Aminobacter anthyllidis]